MNLTELMQVLTPHRISSTFYFHKMQHDFWNVNKVTIVTILDPGALMDKQVSIPKRLKNHGLVFFISKDANTNLI
jgi:hypothetical protein